jgi:dihydrolipoamide dehydrogenase
MAQTLFYDVVILGAGPGGYVAAIRASQLGLKVAIVDKREKLGGTCLNVGCIPSKALLHSSELYYEAQHHFEDHGIYTKDIELNLSKLLGRKDKVVDELTQGISYLMRKNKIDVYQGYGVFQSPKTLDVSLDAGVQTLEFKSAIIATGSDSISLPNVEVDEDSIVSSTGALNFQKVPEHLIVVGGGYIGLELGSVWQRLGSKVMVVEYLDRITPNMDKELCQELKKNLEKQGFQFKLNTKVLGATVQDQKVLVQISCQDVEETLNADVVLVSVGRKPHSQNIGLEALGIETNQRGFILVNDHWQTKLPHIYAIGDVIEGPMLAHKAAEEGIAVAEILAGQSGHVNYNLIPGVIYTHPEAACVGYTEEQLIEKNIPYKVGKFPFSANSRAKAIGDTAGFVKILAHAKTDAVLGVHIIGPHAGTIIAEAVSVMAMGGSSEDIARTCHAHPGFSEAMLEAALGVEKRSLHI